MVKKNWFQDALHDSTPLHHKLMVCRALVPWWSLRWSVENLRVGGYSAQRTNDHSVPCVVYLWGPAKMPTPGIEQCRTVCEMALAMVAV
jgi:hypothetical protein